MSSPSPTVTVLIPALNEVNDIRGCLEAVGAQSYPADLIDVVLVDGCSDDGTAEVARAAADDLHLDIRVVENPRRRTSTSLNAGLDHARGDVIVRLDARSRVQPDYVATCVAVLVERPEVGVVGGRQVPRTRSGRTIDRGIARALTNRYATGLARYRRAPEAGPADTVWMGAFRAADLREFGGWDDEVALNEDWVLNRRYRDAGRLVWFEAELVSGYLPRTDLMSLARQHFYFGRVKGLWWVRGMKPESRQVGMLVGPPAIGLALVVAARRRGAGVLLAVPLGLLVVDAVGVDEPADLVVRTVSSISIAVYGAAWWVGTVVGAVGELLGVEHRHRSAPS